MTHHSPPTLGWMWMYLFAVKKGLSSNSWVKQAEKQPGKQKETFPYKASKCNYKKHLKRYIADFFWRNVKKCVNFMSCYVMSPKNFQNYKICKTIFYKGRVKKGGEKYGLLPNRCDKKPNPFFGVLKRVKNALRWLRDVFLNKNVCFFISLIKGGGVISIYKNLCCRFCIVQEAFLQQKWA